MNAPPVPFVAAYAAQRGLSYSPDADERWIRVWEPYATLKTPLRYEHAIEGTGEAGSLTVARFVVGARGSMGMGERPDEEASAWIAIVQDPRIQARAAATSDHGRTFGEPLDLVSMPRRPTRDEAFDRVFASFSATDDDLARAITPSLRRLVLGWGVPLHFELRQGGFVLAPVALRWDYPSLAWLMDALPLFGEKAAKSQSGTRA